MSTASIPISELTSFDLPPVCVVTGSSDKVLFRPVKFQWYPRWVAGFAIAPVIMVILMLVLTRRAKGELPFCDEGWERWQRAKRFAGVSVAVFILGLVSAGIAMAEDAPVVALVVFLASFTLLIVFATRAGGRGPVATRIDRTHLTLKLPSAAAAQRINTHLAGRPHPATSPG
jgi:hypothetical protein